MQDITFRSGLKDEINYEGYHWLVYDIPPGSWNIYRKQKIITIVVLLFVSINFSYTVDYNRNGNEINLKDKNAYTQQMLIDGENVVTEPLIMQEKVEKTNAVKRFFQKRKKRLFERFGIDNLLSSNRILALMIVGFAILLPGMVLAMLGVALIPAVILALVGGTLMIIGVLAGK